MDMREKQPDHKELDLRKDSFGNETWGASIKVSPYSSLQNCNVYPRTLTVLFKANGARNAHGFAQSISAAISLAHDVWQVNICKMWREQ